MFPLSILAILTASLLGAPLQTPPASEQVDIVDLWLKIRHQERKPFDPKAPILAIAPVVSAKPSTGFVVGIGGNVAKYLGDPATTRISSGVGALTVSTKKQVSLTARFGAYTSEDRWRIDGDNRALWTSQDTYGFGINTTPADKMNVRFDHFRVQETLLRAVRPNLYLGGGLAFNAHINIRPGDGVDAAAFDNSPYIQYTRAHGFDETGQTSAGLVASAVFDTRDTAIDASRGWLARASYRTSFHGFLGADSTWEDLETDVRTYVKLSADGRHTLAGWIFGSFVTGGTPPYFDLPATAMDTYGRSGRGYAEGRFRGQKLVTAEMEYRTTLTRNGLIGAVAFVNTTSVSDAQTSTALFDDFAPGGGVGLRVLFNKHSKTNLCVDFGWGRDSHGLYLALQEVF